MTQTKTKYDQSLTQYASRLLQPIYIINLMLFISIKVDRESVGGRGEAKVDTYKSRNGTSDGHSESS